MFSANIQRNSVHRQVASLYIILCLANLALAFGVLVHVLTFVIPNGTINAVGSQRQATLS
jgi:hypothetical protein